MPVIWWDHNFWTVQGLGGLNFCTSIGVKRMGELDKKPFQTSCKRQYSIKEADNKAATLYSQWNGYLRDPNWYPFTTSMDSCGNSKVTLNEEDEKLKQLKISSLDGEIYKAVTTALVELNTYNTNGRSRTAIAELWNFKQGRKASLKEGISYVLNQLELLRKRVGRMLSEKKLDVKKRNLDDGINEIQKKLEEKDAELKDLKAELEYSLELNSTLSVKDRESNDELQGAHKELIKELVDDGFIGVKRMGELDITPFTTACKREHSMLEPVVWQDYLSDPNWHPFKAIEDEFGNRKEILDVEDEKLKEYKVRRWSVQGSCHCLDGIERVQSEWYVCNGRTMELSKRQEGNPTRGIIIHTIELETFEKEKKNLTHQLVI
uniref:factor of DNA methylation 3-like isoform X2 n=1 Tax=Fragaria vesca subsp. vesca TaxID=101020 RepID=UPI0005CA7ACE|nr:PREDICTED: factor of DNA methylation 3-like isoform X2 [Fragaria vesca subsp. vesca]